MSQETKSLGALIADLPRQITALIQAEIDHLKAEASYKAKHFGVGAGLFAAAAFIAIFALGTAIATAIIALALVVPLWLSSLIVLVVLLIVIAILVFAGIASFKRGTQPPGETVSESVKLDIEAIKGVGHYER